MFPASVVLIYCPKSSHSQMERARMSSTNWRCSSRAERKRATTSLERRCTECGEPYPVTGSYLLVVDGARRAVCIARTTSVETRPFHAVDAEYAWTEGEGDRSLAYWQAAHRTFCEREALQGGFTFDDDAIVVLQRCEVVWAGR